MYFSKNEQREADFEFGLTNKQKQELFAYYSEWFETNNFKVHWETVEFIKFHWRLYATIETKTGKVTHMFFITPSKLTMWVGFKKEHRLIMTNNSGYKPDKINEMREAIK